MKQLATIDDIVSIKEDVVNVRDAMDSLLTRVMTLEYTVQDLQRLIDNLRNNIPSVPTFPVNCSISHSMVKSLLKSSAKFSSTLFCSSPYLILSVIVFSAL